MNGSFHSWFLGLLVALPLSASAADPLLEADQLYREQKFPAAIERLVELSLERPGDAEVQDRLGAARFRSGDFEGAARAYDTAARLRGGSDADELFNAGNAYYQAGRLVDAAERYGQALASDPGHADAAHNRDLVEKEIAARRAIQPPPPPKPDSGGDRDDQGDDPKDDAQKEPRKPQPGQPQDPQDGSSGPNQDRQDQPQDGPPEPPVARDVSDQASRGQNGAQSEPPEAPGSSDAVSPVGVSDRSQEPPDGEPTATAAGEPGQGDDAGPITAGQAHRLLDSIEEGGQRVVVQGRQGQKPW